MARKKTKIDALIDEVLEDCENPNDILGKRGLLKDLTKRIVERVLEAVLTEHLGYERHDPVSRCSGNNPNGKGYKSVQTESGSIEIEVPREQKSTFEPKFIRKRQRRFERFDEKVLALYSRGYEHP